MADNSNSDVTSILDGFRRLALSEGLKKKSKEYKERQRVFIAEAVQTGFTTLFGANQSSLQAWQRLCVFILGEEPCAGLNLSSIKACKEALKGVFVNLVDLVDAATAGKQPKTFPTRKELAKYINGTGKIFPKKRAKANPLLRQFLIVVN